MIGTSALVDKSGNFIGSDGNALLTDSAMAVVVIPLTVTAGSAYAAGNSLDGLKTILTDLGANGKATLTDVLVNCKSAQSAEIDLVIFSANPSGTTVTDKTAFSLAAADSPKVIAVVPLTNVVSLGTPVAYTASGLASILKADANGNIYMAAITRGTPTFGSTSDLSVTLKLVK